MQMKNSNGVVTAVYARTAQQDEQALAWQIGFCRAHCLSRGWERVACYGDDGKSGMRLADRPELTRLMDDAMAGLIARVVVEDLSRLARSAELQFWLIKKLRSFGVPLYVVESERSPTAH